MGFQLTTVQYPFFEVTINWVQSLKWSVRESHDARPPGEASEAS
jgi:hypothetical protein